MKLLLTWLVVFGVLGVGGWLASGPIAVYLKERGRVNYREVEVTRGSITANVNATGTVKPIRSVLVGSFVSGPIDEIFVDFNDEVMGPWEWQLSLVSPVVSALGLTKKGQLLAKIDQRKFAAVVNLNKATLATREAEVKRATAQFQQATNDFKRAQKLREKNEAFISDTEMDQIRFNRDMMEALLTVAETTVLQAKANLELAIADLEYTEIRSPVDGLIIERKIDPGQTVAAAFQTPDLFVIAPDMRKEMYVYANVDESDIGLIEEAQKSKRAVFFTVDRDPDKLYVGTVLQIRNNSTITQNVVTYPVVVSVANPDLKLKPTMTASISFQIGTADKALRIPNAALRFYPQLKQVRPEDRGLLELTAPAAEENESRTEAAKSAAEKAELRRNRNRRHVWVVEGEFLRAVEVVTGLADGNYTELVSGELRDGQKLVTGLASKN